MKAIMTILLLFSFLCVEAQDFSIEGRVISENLELLPYIEIYSNTGKLLCKTDLDGRFIISLPMEISEIKFLSLGMEPTTIELYKNCDYVELVMMYSVNYDFMSLKKVDRLRKRRFNKLPAIHKEAFEKGLFKTDKSCYCRKFMPYRE